MNTTLEGILRLDGALPARQATASPASAWRRELEFAHRRAWFPGATGPAAHDPQSMPESDRDADRLQREMQPPACAPRVPWAPFASSGAVWQAVPSRIAMAGATHSSGVLDAAVAPLLSVAVRPPGSGGMEVPGAPFVSAVAGVAGRSAPAAAAPQRAGALPPSVPQQPEAVRVPLRLHVEDTPQGLTVWLGVDRGTTPPAARTSSLVAELRRLLAASGQRLAGVICNGVPVDGAASQVSSRHQEP